MMSKLFEEISSVERREIIRYYKSKKMKRSYSLNICNIMNNSSNINIKYVNNEKIDVAPVINNNTNKLAYKHDQKIKKMFSEYLIKNQRKTKDFNNEFFDRRGRSNHSGYFRNSFENINDVNNDCKNFTKIRNCTYSNYLKKLN